jgi:hypothetical protein
MLDIRAVAYIAPVSEVDFASVTLTVRIANVADETGLVIGKFRVYNDTTGLLIHTSDIVPFSLAAGATVDASALTDFDPPAPTDDVYFVIFDGHASNALVPDGISFALGAFYFDVKPTGMGPAPAAHHATHEDGGSDELFLFVENQLTTELDPANVLAPDGAGGVHFVPVSAATDHGALTGLADDDHTQYLLRHEVNCHNDFLTLDDIALALPWYLVYITTGTFIPLDGSALQPGIIRISCGTNANSGLSLRLRTNCYILAGSESSILILRPQTLSGTTLHFGFHDATSVTDPVDGAWIWQDPATGIVYGRTSNNSVGTTTGTGFQLVSNTWYILKIVMNSNASRVDFYCYDITGALLWTDSITTNIPTARTLGHGIASTNSGTTAVALHDIDFMSFIIPDRRPDL